MNNDFFNESGKSFEKEYTTDFTLRYKVNEDKYIQLTEPIYTTEENMQKLKEQIATEKGLIKEKILIIMEEF